MRLPPMPTPSEVLKIYGVTARKQLSQNFLLDSRQCDKIVRAAGNLKDCCVCEVGPGPGSITRAILSRNIRKLVVVEKDSRFMPSLKMLRDATTLETMKIVHGDILSYKMERAFSQVDAPRVPWNEGYPNVHILGNLPFSVSTILIIRWLEAIANRSGPFTYGRVPLTLTFQKEVGERLSARPSHKQRSRLSVMAQMYCDVRWDHTIRGRSFVPPPQVDVAVVHLRPLARPLTSVPFKVLEGLVRILFNYRRKTIHYSGKLLFKELDEVEEFFDRAGVDFHVRAQELSNADWCRLCDVFVAMRPGVIPEVTTNTKGVKKSPPATSVNSDVSDNTVDEAISDDKHMKNDSCAINSDVGAGLNLSSTGQQERQGKHSRRSALTMNNVDKEVGLHCSDHGYLHSFISFP